jgi:glucose-6-phosphate 1-dehydrogenase
MKKIFVVYLFFVVSCFAETSIDVSPPEAIHEQLQKDEDSYALILFGATGDLAIRKLYLALYRLSVEGRLSDHMAIIGTGRTEHNDRSFRDLVKRSICTHVNELDPVAWRYLEERLFYHQFAVDDDKGYETLQTLLLSLDQNLKLGANRLYYLATQPSLFETIIFHLNAHHLISNPDDASSWTRVLIEKPFGFNLTSAIDLQETISKYLDESQIYRIDHYLGKEGIEQILALRYDQKFESIWNRHYIDQVQISFSEDLGVGARGKFWEETGALRDFFQNHLMQLLALVAMEIPNTMNSEKIVEEKVRVLQAIRPFPLDDLNNYIIRGQYGPGEIGDKIVPGYRQEPGVSFSSTMETFVAAKLWIDNDRWRGVPFYIRGGKRMSKQSVDITIVYKDESVLHMSIQPQIIIELDSHQILSKKPTKDAYENVIYQGLKGNHAFFVHMDEQLAAWRLLTPVLNVWEQGFPDDFPNYKAGSNGPNAAEQLLILQNHHWLW